MNYEIEVTQADIDSGIKGACNICPVAKAIDRKIPNLNLNVYCNRFIINDNEKGTRRFIDTPMSVFHFVRDFDAGKEVKPFKFVLEGV